MTPRPHDALFRRAFERPADAAAELRHVLPRAIADAIDASSLHLEPGSYVDPELADCYSDLLFSARIGSERTLVYLLLEHQSTLDPLMPLRMLAYLVRVWERHVGNPPKCTTLPPVVGVLVTHAPGARTVPAELHALVRPPPHAIPELVPLVPNLRIIVDDLARTSNAELHARALAPFPKVALWLLRDGRRPKALMANLVQWASAFADVLRAPDGWRAMLSLLHYLNAVLKRERFVDFRAKMVALAPSTEEAVMRYSDAMIEQGRTEGQRAALTKLLTLKFGELDPAIAARIDTATPTELDRALERLLAAESPASVFDP